MQVAGFSWVPPLVVIRIVAEHKVLLVCVSVAAMLFWEVQSGLYCNGNWLVQCVGCGRAGASHIHLLAKVFLLLRRQF